MVVSLSGICWGLRSPYSSSSYPKLRPGNGMDGATGLRIYVTWPSWIYKCKTVICTVHNASNKNTRNIRIIILHKNTCVAVTWTLWCFLGDIHVGSITEFGLGGVTWLMPERNNTLSLSYWWSIDRQYNYRYIMEKDWKLLHVRDAITSTHFTYVHHCFNIKACPLATCWSPDTWHAVLHFKETEFSWNCKTEIIVLALGQFCCECRLLQCSHQVIIVSCVRCSVFQCFITALL